MFFFTSRRRHTMLQCDGSADVCSSDLGAGGGFGSVAGPVVATVFDFDLFQIRNPATPPPRRSTTKTAATIRSEERRGGKEWTRREYQGDIKGKHWNNSCIVETTKRRLR